MRFFNKLQIPFFLLLLLFLIVNPLSGQGTVQLHNDEDAGHLHVIIEGQKAFTYCYTGWLDIPHIWPLHSPSGQNMLVQQTEPYPHHRSFYVADTVKLDGQREVSTYNALYSGQSVGKGSYGPPYRDHIRHDKFTRLDAGENKAVIGMRLIWKMDGNIPVLEEQRQMVVHSLGNGEYLIDMTFELIASFGNVEFLSDDIHYAWPYIRMQSRFSGKKGGKLIADDGSAGEAETLMKPAHWIDYSNTVEGVTEGLAIFQFPDGKARRWLTREYGIFGPRRPDEQSGKPFVVEKDKSITQRVGILVHKGDVESGRVAQRYKQYIQEKWKR